MNLGEQIGPLPLGAWLGVVAGGVGLGFLGRRKRATVATSSAPVKATTAPDSSSMGAVQYVGAGSGTTTMGTPKYATNEEWATAAAAYLIGRGTLASRATNALSHVLYPDASHPTSSEDSALYNMAAAGVGLPPNLPGQAYIPDPPAVGRSTAPTFPGVSGIVSAVDPTTGKISAVEQLFAAPVAGIRAAWYQFTEPGSTQVAGGVYVTDAGNVAWSAEDVAALNAANGA